LSSSVIWRIDMPSRWSWTMRRVTVCSGLLVTSSLSTACLPVRGPGDPALRRPGGRRPPGRGADAAVGVGSHAHCSFCGNDARQGVLLVASELSVPAGKFGDLPRICNECLDLSLEILAETPPA
jgi:hypothetical protein